MFDKDDCSLKKMIKFYFNIADKFITKNLASSELFLSV